MTKAEFDKIKAAKLANPTAGRGVLARLAGVSENLTQQFLKKNVRITAEKNAGGVHPAKKGKTIADFRQAYDKATIIPAKVKAALKEIGVAGWEYESEFCRIAGIRLSDLGMFRDQFAGHVVNLRDSRRVWAGSEKTANIMKEMI